MSAEAATPPDAPRARVRFPLSLQIAALSVFLVTAVSAGVAVFAVLLPNEEERVARERQYRELAKFIAAGGVTGGEGGVAIDVDRLFRSRLQSDLAYVIVLSAAGRVEKAGANPELLQAIDPEVAALHQNDPVAAYARLASVDVAPRHLKSIRTRLVGADGQPRADLVVGFSTRDLNAALDRRLFTSLLVIAGALLLAVVASFALGRALVRPLGELTGAMGRVTAGDLEREVRVRTGDEVGVLAAAFNQMIRGIRERERLKGTLDRYVSRDVAQRILTESSDLDLTGELRRVTVVFMDVRGFTSLSERLSPQQVVGLLNEYFPDIIEVIYRWGGSVNKFLGDAIMAILGAPKDIDDPEGRAVRMAVEIQDRLRGKNADREVGKLPVLRLGIGVNTGYVIAGNVGSAQRLEYTVIGDDVNLAQRLEANARAGEILISQATYDKVQKFVEVIVRDPLMVKGKSIPVQVYEVVGVRDRPVTLHDGGSAGT